MKALPTSSGAFTRPEPFPFTTGDTRKPPFEAPVTLTQQLAACLEYLEQRVIPLPEPYASCVLFFSIAAPGMDASIFFVRRPTFEAAWREGATRVRQWAWARKLHAVDLRIDWAWDITRLPHSGIPASPGIAASWARADEDLEYAELALPVLASTDTQPAPTAPLTQQLHLRGVHIDSQGLQTALPRMQWPAQQLVLSPLPFQAIWQQLAQQHGNGSWPGARGLDHLCMTYALLEIHRHANACALSSAPIAAAIESAVAYLRHAGASLAQTDSDGYMEPALRLLTLARYTASMPPGAISPLTLAHMEKLARDIHVASTTRASKPWFKLALQALVRDWQPAAGASAAAPLVEAFLQLQQDLDGGGSHTPEVASCLAIATLEHLDTAPPLPQWHAAARQLLPGIDRRVVSPELALFLPPMQRGQAAFFESPPTTKLTTSRRDTVHLLLAALALQRLAPS